MKTLKLQRESFNGSFEQGYIRPINKEDDPVFEHCTDGRNEITMNEFNDEFKVILEAHGYSRFSFVDI